MISNEIDEKLEGVYQKAGKELDIKPHVLKRTLWWKKYCRMAYLQGVKDTNSQQETQAKIRQIIKEELFVKDEEV